MALRILILLVALAWPALAVAEAPTLLGQAMEPVAQPVAPAPAPSAPRFEPGFLSNGLSSYGGALLGTLLGLGAVALVPMSSMLGPFGVGAALAGIGSALAQYKATGKIDWRNVFFTSLAGGATVMLGGGAGATLWQTVSGAAMVVGIGRFFGSVKETTRIRRLWFW
jgi:hypothetical protein